MATHSSVLAWRVPEMGEPGGLPSIGEGNGNPFQCPCLENAMDREAWRAAVHGLTESRTRLSDQHTLTEQENFNSFYRIV